VQGRTGQPLVLPHLQTVFLVPGVSTAFWPPLPLPAAVLAVTKAKRVAWPKAAAPHAQLATTVQLALLIPVIALLERMGQRPEKAALHVCPVLLVNSVPLPLPHQPSAQLAVTGAQLVVWTRAAAQPVSQATIAHWDQLIPLTALQGLTDLTLVELIYQAVRLVQLVASVLLPLPLQPNVQLEATGVQLVVWTRAAAQPVRQETSAHLGRLIPQIVHPEPIIQTLVALHPRTVCPALLVASVLLRPPLQPSVQLAVTGAQLVVWTRAAAQPVPQVTIAHWDQLIPPTALLELTGLTLVELRPRAVLLVLQESSAHWVQLIPPIALLAPTGLLAVPRQWRTALPAQWVNTAH
jgi:hypothetical protein